eukprot:GHVR01150555.1.p1 GENE.GHVR01150555.1~~GHVR01150555.1.p1  ORF type:complete len:508 (+),score=91.19 GHVR01150555.1:191-1714(+)
MVYAYWSAGKHMEHAVFDLYFRKCPFQGEFTVFAGVDECLRFLNTFSFNDDQIAYLKEQLPQADPDFFTFLSTVKMNLIDVYAIKEGTFVFPMYPLIRVEGPLALTQLVETSLLNLVNFASLVATNAARHRIAAGNNVKLLEFGLRRAQGPDGAMSASRYSYIGGFDGTSNVRAGHCFGIPIAGTHAHAYVTSFSGLGDLRKHSLGQCEDFVDRVLKIRNIIDPDGGGNDGELAAFIAFAQCFPDNCLCLVDTYDTLNSGVPNFISLACVLLKLGHSPVGIRLDSGDLAYLSKEARKQFKAAEAKFGVPMSTLTIAASNDLNEQVLIALNEEAHEINTFGIGTNLVTCQSQPALGMVYKLAELDGRPCMKISQELNKLSVPSRKDVYRLFSANDEPIIDLIQQSTHPPPCAGERILCHHLFDERKRCYVVPQRVEPLLQLIFTKGKSCAYRPSLSEIREFVLDQLRTTRPEYLRKVLPKPFKVSASKEFYTFFKRLWMDTAPIFLID